MPEPKVTVRQLIEALTRYPQEATVIGLCGHVDGHENEVTIERTEICAFHRPGYPGYAPSFGADPVAVEVNTLASGDT